MRDDQITNDPVTPETVTTPPKSVGPDSLSVEEIRKRYQYLSSGEARDVMILYRLVEELKKERDHANFVTSTTCKVNEQQAERIAELEGEMGELPEDVSVKELREALATAQAENARLGRLYDEERGPKSWGCGHVNHGSCSTCLGQALNERNFLRSEIHRYRETLERISKGWTIMESDELSDLARSALVSGEAKEGE